jgi:16S rRNA (cytosine1402-N4)-methyltransferase
MNNDAGLPLIEKLKDVDEAELTRVIFAYGEERFAKKIAAAMLAAVAADSLHTTQDLADLIAKVIPLRLQDKHKHPATRTFQALRLWVNEELESLEAILNAFPDLLASGGYAAFISFHSLEDRLVKTRMKVLTELQRLPRGLPILEEERMHPTMEIYIKMQKPSSAEIEQNPRSRSAVLRALKKVE